MSSNTKRAAASVEWMYTDLQVSYFNLSNPGGGIPEPADYTYRYIIDVNGAFKVSMVAEYGAEP